VLFDQLEERIKGFAYAAQPERLTILDNGYLVFSGHHRDHLLALTADGWTCDCETFWRFLPLGGWCRHILATQHILTALDSGTARVCQAENVQIVLR